MSQTKQHIQQEDNTMKKYQGYEMEKVTRNTIRIRPIGGQWIDMWGNYPTSFKQAKAVIDQMVNG